MTRFFISSFLPPPGNAPHDRSPCQCPPLPITYLRETLIRELLALRELVHGQLVRESIAPEVIVL